MIPESDQKKMSGPAKEVVSRAFEYGDIQISMEQLNKLTKQHLQATCIKMDRLQKSAGINNPIYFATVAPINNAEPSYDIVLRLMMEFPRYSPWKSVSEVATIDFLRANTSVPVPKVLAYSNCCEEFGFHWMIQERVEGVVLSSIWEELSQADKAYYGEQVLAITLQMFDYQFSTGGSFIHGKDLGAYPQAKGKPVTMKQPQEQQQQLLESDENGIVLTGLIETGVTAPVHSTSAFVADFIRNCFIAMRHDPCFKDFVPPIEQFCTEVLPTLESQSIPFAVLHGDLGPHNIMCEPITKKITAVLDWEWSGLYPYSWDLTCLDFEFTDEQEKQLSQGVMAKGFPGYPHPIWEPILELARRCRFAACYKDWHMDAEHLVMRDIPQARREMREILQQHGVKAPKSIEEREEEEEKESEQHERENKKEKILQQQEQDKSSSNFKAKDKVIRN